MPESPSTTLAMRLGQQKFELQATNQAALMQSNSPLQPVKGTLHQAFDRYQHFLETQLARNLSTPTVEQRKSQIKYLKEAHPDRPLAILGLDECRTVIGYWTSVPMKSETERYSRATCKHRLSELQMFFDWLHMTQEFTWRKPTDFDTISKKIQKTPGEKKSIREIVTKGIFEVSHLAAINRHCDPFDRLLLYLGLNCSFGAAESGRLEMDDFFLRQANPIGHLWEPFGFSSSKEDSWIGYLRPKTGVAGMWWLWPETVAALETWLEERPHTTNPRIIVSSTGRSLYRDDSKNAQSGFQACWSKLLNRAKSSDSSLPSLPFGSLRDQFSNWLVHKHKAETASIALAHGTPFKDDLMKCYANLPFPTLFEEQKEYRKLMQPMFDAVK